MNWTEAFEFDFYRSDMIILACMILADEEDQKWMIEECTVDDFRNQFAKHIFRKIRNLKRAGFKVTKKSVAKAASWPHKEVEELCARVKNYKHSFSSVFDVDFWDLGEDLYGGISIEPL